MKRFPLVLGALLFLAAPLYAGHSLIFSTNEQSAAAYAWQLSWSGVWTMSFPDDGIVVDDSSPVDPVLHGDFVLLPDLTLGAPVSLGEREARRRGA